MARDFSIKFNLNGDKVLVTDETNWTEDSDDRSQIAIIFVAGIFVEDEEFNSLETTTGFSNIYFDTSFTNEEQSSTSFDVGLDGYHRVIAIYADLNSPQSNVENYVYYSSSQNQVFIRKNNSWQAIDVNDLVSEPNIINATVKDVGFSPNLERSMAKIWNRYEDNSFPVKGSDFKNFYTIYGIFVGAISSIRQLAYAEYHRKIELANRIVKRWT